MSSAGGLTGENYSACLDGEGLHCKAAGANACLGEGEKKPQRRINRRATMATMRGKSSSLLLWQTTAPLTGLAYVLQRLQLFRAAMAGRGPTPHSPDRWRVDPIAVAPPS